MSLPVTCHDFYFVSVLSVLSCFPSYTDYVQNIIMMIMFVIFVVLLTGKIAQSMFFNRKKLMFWTYHVPFTISFCLGLVQSQRVSQSPPDLMRIPTGSAVLTCSHSDQGFDLILWYKQSEDGRFIFLGYLNLNFPYPEDQFKNIVLDGDGSSRATLTIHNLTLVDSAVYYCAARTHSVLNPLNPEQKPSLSHQNICSVH